MAEEVRMAVRIFTYDALPGRVIFGPGASRQRLAEEVDRLGARRVLLIATERERELAEELWVPLGDRIVGVFTDVRPHVPVEVAEEARELARRLKADCLLSIGGGSTTGTAKAIALAHGVPVAVEKPEDLEGRSETLYGAYLAGAAFAVAGSGLHHKICHVLGGAYDLPHAEMRTVILPHVVAFNEPAIPEVMERVARAIDAQSAAAGLYDLAERIGAPTALKNIGMKEENLNEAISLVLEKAPDDNPRPVDEAGVRAILEGAYSGRRPGRMPERSL
jgi:alcohol dehydrogenase class IV